MKKHGMILLLSASLLGLAACNLIPQRSSSSQPSSTQGTTSESSSEESSATSTSEEPAVPAADGAFSYVYSDVEERTEILGKLEKYAVENKLTGLTMYGDGGYVMYQESVTKGTNNYIPGYGFGILGEGDLVADLGGESNPDWKRYYHSYETSDPKKLNYQNDKGSVVGDLITYTNAGYFDTQMNETKDGYVWVGDLSKAARPIAVDPNDAGYASTYRFPVKVGSELKYSTTSEKYAKYNNREVQLEDYITPYKIYYTAAYGMVRGNENLSGAGSIKGAASYYAGSAEGFNESLWANIGIKAYVDDLDGQSYLEFTFNQPTTRFYAMYYLTSGMFAPVPEEFITEIGGGDFATGTANWGVFTDDESIIDHWLCTGAYKIERWDIDKQIVFQKNENYADRGRYKIQGVHLNILAAAESDPEAAFNEFLLNKLHATSIPSTQLENYKDDPRTTVTADSSTYKLNMNTCDQETWEELFGENGSIEPHQPGTYWDVKPAMSNKDFVSGLSFALDRKTLAEAIGRTPSGNYFGNGYMSDPENGIRYNDTQAHEDAVASLMEGTDGYGYSLESAKAAFQSAAEQLIAEGAYEEGDTIEIEIAWQTTAQVNREHKMIEKNLTDAFNTDENPLRLKVNSWVGATWSDVYYDKMMTGEFDIGFGSISGNTLNPLNFLEVLKSDNSSGFTLNWGLDTNEPCEDLVFDGKYWSFDALWTAADQGAYVVEGANAPLFTALGVAKMERFADGSLAVTTGAICAELYDEEGEPLAITFTSEMAIYMGSSSKGNYTEFDLYPVTDGDGNKFVALETYANASSVEVEDRLLPSSAFQQVTVDGIEYTTVTFPADVVAAIAEVAVATYGVEAVAVDVYKAQYFLGDSSMYTYVASFGPYKMPAIPAAE
ncbi:MAG: hypothetical protein K6E59_06470 [Bacilli bacterium]|nr:hypothetical protein [Bacilli bacterium]